MIELSIRFTGDEKDPDSPIQVSLFRPDTGVSTRPVLFTPPLDDRQLGDIRWYLEVFSTWPTGPDYERAERIESELEEWGRALLHSVTRDRDAGRLWQQFVDGDGDKLLTLDATDPRVLRLPWELLADEGGHVFTQGISVRRRLQKVTASPPQPLALPVRILVVVARPDDANFIDPRADAISLLDAVAELGGQAEVEFLYPPTLPALAGRLRDKQAPPVHVVHFDGHGRYDAGLGLGYLLFENKKHQSDPVDANRLGTLLNKSGVPVMVLSACQSATQQEANPYASVAARLIRAGAGSVLAMNYSVLVPTMRKFVRAFYGALADGRSVGQAVDEGRVALYADEERFTLSRPNADGDPVEETIRLRDWFLPALYQQAADPVILPAPASPPARSPAPLPSPSATALPDPPLHGFHGRSRELLQLERAFAQSPIVVLHGFGGLGKTALAAEAGRWFTRSGRFPGGAAFISFEGGGSLQQLCSWVGQALSGDPDWFIHGEGDPVARVAALLAEKPALIILDNFESVLGRDPLMPPAELKAVLDAVYHWAVGRIGKFVQRSKLANLPYSCVLITTRDTTFNDARFAPSRACRHVALSGLAPYEALELAAAVFDDYVIDRAAIPRRELVALMDRLGGHPLSLNLVLPHLRHHTPAELTARFEELLPGFTQGEAKERNESLALSLEFSLRRLGAATRAALPDLAVFQGRCMEYDLLAITGMDKDLWQAARAELEQAALVVAERVPGIAAPFLRFHPTLLPYLATQLPNERRSELEEKYWREYYGTANSLYQLDTQQPHVARAIAAREMPNLRRALALALAAGALDEAVDFADSIAKFLDNFGRWREREAMMARVSEQWSVNVVKLRLMSTKIRPSKPFCLVQTQCKLQYAG